MIECGIVVKACCGTCRTFFKVDLALLRPHFRPHYSLISKRGKCPIFDLRLSLYDQWRHTNASIGGLINCTEKSQLSKQLTFLA